VTKKALSIMHNKITILALVFMFTSTITHGQTNVRFTLNHKLGDQAFAFNQEAQNDKGESFNLRRMEYYISAISIVHDGGKTTPASDVFILVDASKTDTVDLGSFDVANIESITFSVGVDPSENNEDPTKWNQGHPLAPRIPSMHWGWAAGYRFVALEGKSGASLNQELQIHALGNKNFFEQNIPVEPETVHGDLVISLNADYEEALTGISISNGLIEHSENGPAIACLKNFYSHVFTNLNGEGNTLSTGSVSAPTEFSLFPNPSTGTTIVSLGGNKNAAYDVFSSTGEKILSGEIRGSSERLTFEKSGIYFIRVHAGAEYMQKKILIL
jgi:hypothetical protein